MSVEDTQVAAWILCRMHTFPLITAMYGVTLQHVYTKIIISPLYWANYAPCKVLRSLCLARVLGLELKSCEGEVEVVQKSLAHGLFCNAVRFETTTYSATEKHHTGTDLYSLVHNAGPGISLCSVPLLKLRLSMLAPFSRIQWETPFDRYPVLSGTPS